MRRTLVLGAALILGVACGSVDTGSSSVAGRGDAGTTPAGDAGTGGTGDAGTPAGGDAGTGGTGDAGTPPGGNDAGTGGTGDAGTPAGDDGGTGGTGGDAGTPGGNDGGTAQDDCNGLAAPADPGPAPSSHFIPMRNPFASDGCAAGAGSGQGTLALEMVSSHAKTLDVVSPSGATLQSPDEGQSMVMIGGANGFIGAANASIENWLVAFDASGNRTADAFAKDDQIGLFAENPLRGVVTLGGVYSFSPHLTGWDEALNIRWTVAAPGGNPVALGVDRAGAALYLFDGSARFGAGTVAGMWIDDGGNAGPVFQAAGPSASYRSFTFAQRVGSGLFVAENGEWTLQLDSLSTSPAPAPDWLRARPNVQLHMVHGGAGYAVLPPPSSGAVDCAQDVDVVSPSGKTCSTTRFRAAPGTCTTASITVGYEGTVIQNAPDPDPSHQTKSPSGLPDTCYWHWWPAFFR